MSHLQHQKWDQPCLLTMALTYLSALEQQNSNLMELIRNVQAPKAGETDGRASYVSFPKCNPDIAGTDVSSWCNTIDLILADNAIEEGNAS